MELSKRFSQLQPSPTLALDARAKELIRQGTKVYNFSVGEPDFSTADAIIQAAIGGLKQNHYKYGPSGGSPALRQAVVSKLQRDNQLTFEVNHIVCGIGAKEILFHLCLALLNEGDEVIIPAPYWVSYTTHVQAAGAISVVAPMPENIEGAPITPEMLAPLFTAKTKAIFLNSPNNPAGYVIKKEDLMRLGQFLLDKKVWIISDEIYEYMAFDAPHYSLLQLFPQLKDRFILVNGLSKGFAMTGFRVGYCAAPPTVAALVRTLQSQSSTCIPGFVEDAAIVALDQGPKLMGDKFKLLQERRNFAVKLLREMDGIRFVPPQGAFYIYADIRTLLRQSKAYKNDDSMGFSNFLLEKHQVAMVPGEAFGTKGFLRMSYAVNNNDLQEGLGRLNRALREC